MGWQRRTACCGSGHALCAILRPDCPSSSRGAAPGALLHLGDRTVHAPAGWTSGGGQGRRAGVCGGRGGGEGGMKGCGAPPCRLRRLSPTGDTYSAHPARGAVLCVRYLVRTSSALGVLTRNNSMLHAADWNCVKVEGTLRRYWRSLISLAGYVRLRWINQATLDKTVRKPSALVHPRTLSPILGLEEKTTDE